MPASDQVSASGGQGGPAGTRVGTGWDTWLEESLDAIRGAGQWRNLIPLDGTGPRFVLPDGREVLSFASNDYLGLAAHPAVRGAAVEALRRWGAGAGSSRLVVGSRPAHSALEDSLASWKGGQSALVFPTGYQANLAVMTTLGAGARVVSDELNHASIIDGARLARTEVTVYAHGDAEHAEYLVSGAPGRAMIVTDAVFSMDGDAAPIGKLSEVAARWGALLVLDEAHAVFETEALEPDAAWVRVGTLSKTLGSQGGFVVAGRRWIELLVNAGRSFIFTTGLAPPSAAAANAALDVLRSAEGSALLARLRENVEVIRPGHPSPVVPFVIGGESEAVEAAGRLLATGLLVPAIRPPTVPAGTSRLRVSLSAGHLPADTERLARELELVVANHVQASPT